LGLRGDRSELPVDKSVDGRWADGSRPVHY